MPPLEQPEKRREERNREKRRRKAIEARLSSSDFNSVGPSPVFADIPPGDPFQVFWASFSGMHSSVFVSSACYSKGAGTAPQLSQPDVTRVTLPDTAGMHLPIPSPLHGE